MRLGASTAPKSPQTSIPILSHKLHPWLRKYSVAQTIPEGSVLQGHPRMLWPICCWQLSWKLGYLYPPS